MVASWRATLLALAAGSLLAACLGAARHPARHDAGSADANLPVVTDASLAFDGDAPDASASLRDASVPDDATSLWLVDAGLAPSDAGTHDAGSSPFRDAGTHAEADAGTHVTSDAGSPAGHDAGTSRVDAGTTLGCALGVDLCDGETGLCSPEEVCSTANPCPTPSGTFLTTSITRPLCRTTAAGRPAFDDGPPRSWTDPVDGQTRYACLHAPASSSAPRPLVLFFHGASGTADSLYDYTSLRSKSDTFRLAGAGGPAGFVLVADEARNTHASNRPLGYSHHEVFYRDLGSPSSAPDIRNVDRLIDDFVASGGIDPRRIYAIGWSNGGFFATFYGIARHTTPTPGGHRIAAVAVFAGADPFSDAEPAELPTCAWTRPLHTELPVLHLGRACESIVGCDYRQRLAFGLPAGYDVSTFIERLRGPFGDPNVTRVILDIFGAEVSSCTDPAFCSQLVGAANHLHWPDGISDGHGRDWEVDMLTFLASHPLPP